MSNQKPYSNAGVDGSGGYEFQKNCALYVFLEKYIMHNVFGTHNHPNHQHLH